MSILFPENIIKGSLSISTEECDYVKAKLQRIKIKQEDMIQVSFFTKQQVYHQNIKLEEVSSFLNQQLNVNFKSLELFTEDFIYYYKITSKGKLLTNRKKQQNEFLVLEHNKNKQYLLTEGMIIPPMIDLGVMTPDGKVVKDKWDKFKQINRFLELIEDSIQYEKELKIIDFGCGKSYLTFILYYYLTYVKKIHCQIIGLDLKEDVIDHCNEIALKYQYKHLTFLKGDISKFHEMDHIDMVITLHACDTATDYAIYHAIQMKSRYIFSVPCCQKEINQQLKINKFHIIAKHGILKERFSSILTDALRSSILQYCGYKTQVVEFVDFDATPKNVLIRATYDNLKPSLTIKNELDELIQYFEVNQTLYHLIFNQK
jgi:hypothetical protein